MTELRWLALLSGGPSECFEDRPVQRVPALVNRADLRSHDATMTAGCDTTWLCKGCGSALALSYRNPKIGRVEQIIEADKNARGRQIHACIQRLAWHST